MEYPAGQECAGAIAPVKFNLDFVASKCLAANPNLDLDILSKMSAAILESYQTPIKCYLSTYFSFGKICYHKHYKIKQNSELVNVTSRIRGFNSVNMIRYLNQFFLRPVHYIDWDLEFNWDPFLKSLVHQKIKSSLLAANQEAELKIQNNPSDPVFQARIRRMCIARLLKFLRQKKIKNLELESLTKIYNRRVNKIIDYQINYHEYDLLKEFSKYPVEYLTLEDLEYIWKTSQAQDVLEL